MEPIQTNKDLVNQTNDTTTNANEFLNLLSEEFKNEPTLKDFKDVNGLAKSYINASKLIGKSDIPTEKSSSEEWNSFYNKIGRPESVEKYSIPENINGYDADFLKNIQETCFKAGISNKQFNDIMSAYSQLEQKQEDDYLNSIKEQETNLLNEFNKEFGSKTEEVKNNVRNLIDKFATDKDKELLNGITDNKTIIAISRMFNNMYNTNFTEGRLKNNNSSTGLSLSELKEKMNSMKSIPFYNTLGEYQDLEKQIRDRYSNGEKMLAE